MNDQRLTPAGAVCVLDKRHLADIISVAMAIITLIVLFRFKKIPEPLVILAAALIGLLTKNRL